MSIKEILKKNDFLRKIVKQIKIKKEYKRDASDFCKNYMEARTDTPQLEYSILLIVHSLEKGLSSKMLRPFGEEKVLELIQIMKQFSSTYIYESKTPYNMGVGILQKWKDVFDTNKWEKTSVYKKVEIFLNEKKHFVPITVGAFKCTKEEVLKYAGFDYLNAIKTRHSVREFSKKKIAEEDIEYCVKAAIASPSACNRQMCKVYQIENSDKISMLANVVMGLGGFDRSGVNYFVFTYDIASFSFCGERNQGNFNAGLFAMNFVNALHFKGIGSCFLQWGNTAREDEMIRDNLGLSKSERIVVVLAAGYYTDDTISPCSCRKNIDEVYQII